MQQFWKRLYHAEQIQVFWVQRAIPEDPLRLISRLPQRCAGTAASPLLTGGGWTDWLKRPALSWDALRDPVELFGERRMMAELSSLMENTSDPMQDTLTALSISFGDRLHHPRRVKERYHRSFYTAVILNTSFTTTAKKKKMPKAHKISYFFPFFSHTNTFLIMLIRIQIRFFFI